MIKHTFHPIGDEALLIQFHEIKQDHIVLIHYLTSIIMEHCKNRIIEAVPAFQSIAVYYNPINQSYCELIQQIEPLLSEITSLEKKENEMIEIPVCYEPPYGLDLEELSLRHKLSIKEIIDVHCQETYTIAIMGFLPGFPYLTGLNEKLFTPRKATPRTIVPKGSVGIGGSFTGIYPFSSPGGWNIIGQTPLSIFDAKREKPFLFQPGNLVRFYPITEKEFKKGGFSHVNN
jgi:inhibitor of KinA